MFWDHIYKPNTPLKWWNWLQEFRILVVGLVFWEGQIKKHTITNNYIDSGRTLPSGILNRTFMKRCQTENVCVLCLFKGNNRIIKHCFLSISLEWCWSPPGLCSGTCLVSTMSHYDHPAFLIIFTFNHSGEKCLKVRPQSSSLILQIHLFQRILIRRLMGTMAIYGQ